MIVPQNPAQDLAAFSRCLAAKFASFFADLILDNARLTQGQIAINQHWSLAHWVQFCVIVRAAGGPRKKVNKPWLPVETAKLQRQRRLIAVAAFAKAM